MIVEGTFSVDSKDGFLNAGHGSYMVATMIARDEAQCGNGGLKGHTISISFCVVAHWYKRRVRDEDYSPQRVVEEVYDRYLTAAAAQSRSYGTHN